MLLLQQVNAVSRTRFQLRKQHRNTQRTKHTRTRKWPIIVHILHEKTKISFLALANRNAKAGVNPTPALIETTANPKRCGFPLSRKKSGPSGQFASTNELTKGGYSIFLILLTSFIYSSTCFLSRSGAANVKMIRGFLAPRTST